METKQGSRDNIAASNQLRYDLSTAQSQRCALGLADEVVFGAVFLNGIMTVYSSSWYSVSLAFHSFSLSSFTQITNETSGPYRTTNLKDVSGYTRKENSIYATHEAFFAVGCSSIDCTITCMIIDQMVQELSTFDIPKAVQSLRANPWRSADEAADRARIRRGNSSLRDVLRTLEDHDEDEANRVVQ
jgi:hypothetical protein